MYPLQIAEQEPLKIWCQFHILIHILGLKMNPEALSQLLVSLNINPDKIDNEMYAKIICVLLFIVDEQIGGVKFLRQRSKSFEMKSAYSMNNLSQKLVALTRKKTFLLKKREEQETLQRPGAPIQVHISNPCQYG